MNLTRAIKNNRLKMTAMEIGSSFVGSIQSIETNEYGQYLKVLINGNAVSVFPSGSFKDLIKTGDIQLGDNITVTRLDDVPVGKFKKTTFDVQLNAVPQATTAAVQPAANSLADTRAALKAKIQAAKANANS